MKNFAPTRRGTLLSALFAGLAGILTIGRAAVTPASDPNRRTWRRLGPEEAFMPGDVGCAINPELVAQRLTSADSSVDKSCYLSPVSDWLLSGCRVCDLSSPDPKKFFWWRAETST